VGKVLGIPRHPSKDGYLPSCVHVCDQSKVGLLLGTNVPTLLGVHQLVMHAFRRGRFCYPLFLFNYLVHILGFQVKQWQGIPKTITLFTKKKFDWFGHDQDLIFPWVAWAKWSII
jgi:hypothetical protein